MSDIQSGDWKAFKDVKNPICPIISALTVKQSNKYIECIKEKCMWWNKCKEVPGCKFRSPTNCDFCAFHSDCDEHWKEGETE